MPARLNIGLIGLGRLGRVYAINLANRVPNANLVAVADRHADFAETFANDFGIPRWYKTHTDLLADKNVDAVVVLTSTKSHKEVAVWT